MVKHPGARRVQQRPKDSEDALIGTALEASVWAREHARPLIIAGVILVALIAGVLYYRSYTSSMNQRAETRLGEIRTTVASGNRALAERDLDQFLARFGGTRHADDARVLLAQMLLEQGNFQRAIEVVQPAAEDLEDPMGPQAATLLAAAYEGAGQSDRAEDVYMRMAEDARLSYQRRVALEQAAHLRLREGNAAGAAQLYERLVGMTEEGTAERAVYEMRLAEARAQAGA